MDAAQEVKSRLSIEDVISEYVQLKRAGRNFKGLSPFTNEKTPSFIVSPEKQIWHDFSSGQGGDIFSFVMNVEGLDFKGALELLARKAGVDLDQFKTAGNRTNTKLKARTLETLELAAKFYQKQLTVNNPALEYLINKRKFHKETILAWQLGYSPNKGTALVDFLTKNGFTTDEMQRAGLVSMRGRGARDMFRGRVMIPLCDGSGQVVGFTARLLADEPNSPKYINTPATLVYDKSRQIFGLHLAKEAIRKEGFVVVAEGNLDVITSWQAGVKNIVASAGTAMTEAHLRGLKRFTGDIRLSFDSDRAGVAATERIIPLAQKAEVSLSIINIAGAKDPDELIHKNPAAWKRAIEQSIYAPDWLIERYLSEVDVSTATGKRIFTDTLISTIGRLRDPVEQEHYLKKLAELTDTSFEAVQAKFSSQPTPQQLFKKSKYQPAKIDVIAVEHQRLQDHFLGMLLAKPSLRSLLDNLPDEVFMAEQRREVAVFLKENPDFKGELITAAKLQSVSDYVKIIMLQFEELYKDLSPEDLKDQAEQLKHRLIDRYVKIEKEKLAQKMKDADGSELDTLVKKADQLNLLIR
jgi:DNA primase